MTTTGAVTISPSGVVTVCNGDELELTCAITESGGFAILAWNVIVISENPANHINYTHAISPSTPSNQTIHRMVNSTNITFSRISVQNSFPLMSRLLMNPVSNHLNGTQMNCLNSLTSESPAFAVVNVSNGNPIQGVYTVYRVGRGCCLQLPPLHCLLVFA